jgi:hypothetical protein
MRFGESYFPDIVHTQGTTSMTFSQMPIFAEIAAGHSGPEIPSSTRAYFQQRLRNRIFNFLLEKFVAAQRDGLTKAALARRIGKSPEVINRWLGIPSNLTIDSVSDLLLGITAEELEPGASSPLKAIQHNYSHFEALRFSVPSETDAPNYTKGSSTKSAAILGSLS